jgi:16S rRNA (uracil1498-N3)-methyltransferase
MPDRYYAPDVDPLAPSYVLDEPEAHHLLRVRRARVGDRIELFDGRGARVAAVVREIHKRRAVLDLGERTESPQRSDLVVSAPLPKGDRAAMVVEKCVELGVARLVPLETERSVAHPGEGKLEKWKRTVVEACKQCGRDDLMDIDPPTPLASVLSAGGGGSWFMDPSGEPAFASVAAEGGRRPPRALAVGPEGGWTSDEIGQARRAGWEVVALPGRVLRIETAVVAAVSLVQFGPFLR